MKSGIWIILLLVGSFYTGSAFADNSSEELFYPQYWYTEGVAQYSLHNYDRALVLLDKAITQDPTLASAYMWRSQTLSQLGRTSEAQDSMNTAKELDSLIDDPYRKKVGALADVTITPVPTARPQQTEDKLKDMIQSDIDLGKKPDPTGPDMVLYDLQAQVNPITSRVEITAVIGNEGIKPSRDFFITFFGSYTTPVSYQDTPIGFYFVDNLLPGTKKTISGFFAIAQIPAGDYYIGAYIDPNNQIMEASEENNGKTAPVIVKIPEVPSSVGLQLGNSQLAVPTKPVTEPIATNKPDIVIEAITGPDSAILGDEFAVNTTVKNIGDLDAGKFRLSMYLSKDSTVTDDDILLGFGDVPDLQIGKSRIGSAMVSVPLNTPPGSYYLVALADSKSELVEKDKLNNSRAKDGMIVIAYPLVPDENMTNTSLDISQTPDNPVEQIKPESESNSSQSGGLPEILPDIAVLDITSDTTGKPGGSINVTTAIRNNGEVPAETFTVSLYLSADTIINASEDLLVGLGEIADLPAGTQRTGNASAPIPTAIKPGVYYFGLIADSYQNVSESNENNNSGYSKKPIVINTLL